MRSLPKTVIILGIVSFLNDFSSEMIYPLLPVFLSTVLGAGAIALGTIEGVAELVASLLKIFSGMMADRMSRRKPLVAAGYTVSGLARPLIGLATFWPVVLVLRVIDRVGKGVRTAPRDALIADVVNEGVRGKAFGLQRALDHAGAVVGPLAAMALLALGMGMRQVFFLAVIPAAAVMVILGVFLKESSVERNAGKRVKLFGNWRGLGVGFHRVLLAILVFTLGNSTDAFLLLKLNQAGVEAEWIAGLWAFHHLMKAGVSTLGGWFSDRFGRRNTLVAGWLYYSAVYLAFALVQSPAALIGVFVLYGIYYGLAEPTEKAWVADLAPVHLRGEAFGWYNGAVGIAALPASVLFGVIWANFGSAAAFLTGAALALAATSLLFAVPNPKRV